MQLIKTSKRLITCTLCLVCFMTANGQKTEEDTLLIKLNKYFTEVEDIIFNSQFNTTLPLDYATEPNHDISKEYTRKTESDTKALSSSTGLQVTGQAYRRLDGDLGLNEDDEIDIPYTAKFQLGVEWDFFKSPPRP